MNIILNLLVSGIVVGIASYLTPGVETQGYLAAIIVAVALAIVNSTIAPVLKLLTLPLNIVTLGLASLVINVLMVMLVAAFVPGFTVNGFWSALIFAVILSLVNMVIGNTSKTRV